LRGQGAGDARGGAGAALETVKNVILDWLLEQIVVKIQPDPERQMSDLDQTTSIEVDLEAANDQNAAQLKLISTRFTIWKCVGTFSAQPSDEDWKLLSLVLDLLHSNGCDCPWMRGDVLGVFGETP
jgi:hypothetical protein